MDQYSVEWPDGEKLETTRGLFGGIGIADLGTSRMGLQEDDLFFGLADFCDEISSKLAMFMIDQRKIQQERSIFNNDESGWVRNIFSILFPVELTAP